jgi:superfamily I DNA and/or RNA helicase
LFLQEQIFFYKKCWPIYHIAGLQVVIETVDSFQGKQMDVVIMSCVRASEPGLQTGIGFVSDIRRMNVAITRAKRALWILGSAATLKVSRFLKHLHNVERVSAVPRRF